MAYDASGKWSMEDDGVASRVAAISSGNSDLMKAARTQGLQSMQRRGLGNSSMAVGAAQGAALNAAVPIASQEASQIAQKNLTRMGADADMEKTRAALAAEQQKAILSSVTDLTGQRFNAMSNTLANDKIPAGTRSAVQSSINAQYQQAIDQLQNLYGISLSSPTQAVAAPTTGTLTPAQIAALNATGGYNGLFRG